ncbi:hypothetical protein, partial [Vibrio hyugaensis]|uniref:hypothetical protein n=1 Tax=Vibrio hyugaensis TaxID=1534743 RepID=UPI0005EE78E1
HYKYGLPNNVKFVLNVAPHDYLPLNCLVCKEDILGEQMINMSLALIRLNKNEELSYLYGCKKCISHLDDLAWLELIQGLHQEEFLEWVKGVDDLIQEYPLEKDFYKNKSNFESRIIQRMYPSNWGRWLNLL